ncbi:histamine H2 receptor [Uranotaenia lowii]|uniref:histamine H2 receptor n=1 Tax=Uranotaenia lowii TaxID=190385 RepID=UPI002479262D|nr:histamine H2 receptor [Uranotaenia lowii]XP_055596322.1 histamine H2 receptor [Uranotaenia lowii]XP_055596331.1 histamine H2 receptor [Uranotaenia lowii]XP_055596341.1 histamine H2 receptor [Uranotaenia lowii]
MLIEDSKMSEAEAILEADDLTTIRIFVDRVSAINEDLLIWAIIDGILVACILSGNILTILAVRYHRRLRSLISNLFVLSLALSDIFVGLTLPYHLAFYMGNELGRYKHFCLLRFFILIVACSVSIWNLIAIAVDRYIAICYPLHYTRLMTKRAALSILGFGWLLAFTLGMIPVIWNRWETAMECEFDELLYPWYVAGVITPIFSIVWLCLLVVYWRIWREAAKHAKQLRAHNAREGSSDWKSVQVVLLIMGCFTICWFPYFVVVVTQIFVFFEENSAMLYKAAFSLAMANSMMNPIIYAWKNSHFRQAFSKLLTCRKPDNYEGGTHTMDSHRGQSSRRIDESRSHHVNNNSQISPTRGSLPTLNDHEITVISTIPAEDALQNHTIQFALSGINGNPTAGPTNIKTRIIKGNVIINNYNVYEGFQDLRRSEPVSIRSDGGRNLPDGSDDGSRHRKFTDHDCDSAAPAQNGFNNPSFVADVTRF